MYYAIDIHWINPICFQVIDAWCMLFLHVGKWCAKHVWDSKSSRKELSGQRKIQRIAGQHFLGHVFFVFGKVDSSFKRLLLESSQIQVVKCCQMLLSQARTPVEFESFPSKCWWKKSLAMSSDEGRKTRATCNTCTFNAGLKVRCPQNPPNWTRWLWWTLVYAAGKGGKSSDKDAVSLCGQNITTLVSCGQCSWSSSAFFIVDFTSTLS